MIYTIPKPMNESPLHYMPGSPERAELKAELERQMDNPVDIPLIINGVEIHTKIRIPITAPHDHRHVLAYCSQAGEKELKLAIKSAIAAKEKFEQIPWEHRAALFLKAAELVSTKYRARLCAATMLGQSKTVWQAEIDAACEITDYLRFNTYYADQIYRMQPDSGRSEWNRLVYRPLEGFVLAISPFNFTAIGANLVTAPVILGNVALWKPAEKAALSSYFFIKLLEEAGLPAGIINFIPSCGLDIGKYVINAPNLAGIHFTGSTTVFNTIWNQIGLNIGNYISYPRIVGETGGKGFVFAHSSADITALGTALIRGAFEYQGQKCSAASRAFIPESIWPELKETLLAEISSLKVGSVLDFRNFMSAVIDKTSFNRMINAIDEAKASPDAELLCGKYDGGQGYFVHPTIIQAKKRDYSTMREELFGPILTIFVYPDQDFDETLRYCDTSTAYALTGAIFARERDIIVHMEQMLKRSAGNLYINDKPTGAVVGRQPFGGARASGTNDKAGSPLNLYRWISPMTVKECFNSPVKVAYPLMSQE
ncbi:MAG: L-glutamate gamma-semialdehyde dehydrogenase [Defluviitaleaceae bacterium]|nr:L-glutamate gamma-semialdehyde dehydrogenase [Defluviitaleaceae bacterium]